MWPRHARNTHRWLGRPTVKCPQQIGPQASLMEEIPQLRLLFSTCHLDNKAQLSYAALRIFCLPALSSCSTHEPEAQRPVFKGQVLCLKVKSECTSQNPSLAVFHSGSFVSPTTEFYLLWGTIAAHMVVATGVALVDSCFLGVCAGAHGTSAGVWRPGIISSVIPQPLSTLCFEMGLFTGLVLAK